MFTADPKFMASMRVTLFFVHLLGAAEARLRARASPSRSTAASSGLPLYRAIFYLPSLLGASVAIAVLWRQLFAGDGLVNTILWQLFGIQGPSWISHPDYSLWTLIILVDLAVRLADDHLPRRPAADPAGHVRGGEPRRRLRSGGSSGRSPCRC